MDKNNISWINGHDMNKDTYELIFEALDKDKDGCISPSEFNQKFTCQVNCPTCPTDKPLVGVFPMIVYLCIAK